VRLLGDGRGRCRDRPASLPASCSTGTAGDGWIQPCCAVGACAQPVTFVSSGRRSRRPRPTACSSGRVRSSSCTVFQPALDRSAVLEAPARCSPPTPGSRKLASPHAVRARRSDGSAGALSRSARIAGSSRIVRRPSRQRGDGTGFTTKNRYQHNTFQGRVSRTHGLELRHVDGSARGAPLACGDGPPPGGPLGRGRRSGCAAGARRASPISPRSGIFCDPRVRAAAGSGSHRRGAPRGRGARRRHQEPALATRGTCWALAEPGPLAPFAEARRLHLRRRARESARNSPRRG
jgi:hypothetical protein